MPGIQTLKPANTSLRTLRKHWRFLLVRVQSEPWAAPFVAPVVAFGPQWDTVAQRDTSLSDARLQAKATAITADQGLNHLGTQVSAAIHQGKKADVSLPIHKLYFGNSTPSDAARPILGTQLELMRPWPELLGKATQPVLLALAPAATTVLAAADAAATKLTEAETADDKFRLDGELRQLFAAYNALAATTFGGLKAIVHERPELKLGSDWAESFFLHESRSQGPTTVQQATADVKKIEGELALANQLLADLVQKQQAAEQAAEDKRKAKAAVTAAKKETAAAKQKENDAIEAAKKAKKAKT